MVSLWSPVVEESEREMKYSSTGNPNNRIPILVITADARVHDKSDIPGTQDMLLKPFQIDALLTLVEHYLVPLPGGS
jgi:CheY-like chemotaxis protein